MWEWCWAAIRVAEGQFRLRINYSKAGRLRYLSHLEVVRAMERSIRRAQLPYAITRGFSPHMKIAFGPALPVGTAGMDEYLDVWTTSYIPVKEVLARLVPAVSIDLPVIAAGYVDQKATSLAAALTIGRYEVQVNTEHSLETVTAALDSLMRCGSVEVQRKGKVKTLDLNTMIAEVPKVTRCAIMDSDVLCIAFATRATDQGSLRPEVFLNAAFTEIDAIEISGLVRVGQFVETREGFVKALKSIN